MFRSTTSVLALLAAMTVPALAADYGDWDDEGDMSPDFRDGYPTEPGDWAGLGDKDDPISLEIGTRYWYSIGSQNFSALNGSVEASDATHTGELHLRIEDHSTNTFAKANIGYSIVSTGTYTHSTTVPPLSYSSSVTGGHIAYAGADFGWNAIGDNNGSGGGVLVGYQFWNDNLTGQPNITDVHAGDVVGYNPATGQTDLSGESVPNEYYVNALRMGVQGKAKLGDFFDISGEVVAVPYANVSGTVGIDDPTFSTAEWAGEAQFPYSGTSGNISSMRSSATTLDGWGYGAQAEAWLGIHPTENLTFRLGGRASYLQGTVDQTYTRSFIPDPGPPGGPYTDAPVVTETGVLEMNTPFQMMRYGLLAEFTYAF
jgi:hypothetical protein